MTFYEKCKEVLTQHGLFPDEATAIMEAVKAADKTIEHRWYDDTEGYPSMMLSVILVTVKRTALDWLKKNRPMHWAIPMFDPDDPLNKEVDEAAATKKF